jgi:hypothetical protein
MCNTCGITNCGCGRRFNKPDAINIPGDDGLSAYEIWINEGNTGTEQDFLDSLVGPQGVQGVQGNPGVDGSNGAISGVQDEGTPLSVQPNLNFVGDAVEAVDNAGNNSTDVIINKSTYPVDKINFPTGPFTPGGGAPNNISGTLYTIPVGGDGVYEILLATTIRHSGPSVPGTCEFTTLINGLAIDAGVYKIEHPTSPDTYQSSVTMITKNKSLVAGETIEVNLFLNTAVVASLINTYYVIEKK